MSGHVLVLVEHWAGEVDGVTHQLLTKGRELADELGTELVALLLGSHLEDVAAALQPKGMDALLLAQDPELEPYCPEVYAPVIGQVIRDTQPRIVLLGYTLRGMELAPAVAARLGAPLATNCSQVEIREGEVVMTRPLFNGTLHARIAYGGRGPIIVGVQKGALPARALPPRTAKIVPFSVSLRHIPRRTRVVQVLEQPAGEIDIAKAELIVAVGRGVGEEAKLPLVQALAEALGGVLACSRPLVDVGWLPPELQVGASGKTVSPKVYIACGISGASQHVAGMQESKLIIAINKDPTAPIFQVAHYGVVADMFDIIPAWAELATQVRAEAEKSAP